MESKPETSARPVLADDLGEWLCVWCHNRVAHERDRFTCDGKDEFTFANPQGVRFEIITFSEIRGCRRAGDPILEYSWFPGHAWSYCTCGECGQHLGWYYTGKNDFVGLIKDRIVRALHAWN